MMYWPVFVTWLGRVPDEYLSPYVQAHATMNDAPAPEGMNYPESTAEKVRASEESLRQRDRKMRLTIAIDEPEAIAAFTELRVSAGSTLGFTDDTGTVAARRRLGLARAVKLESLRRLRADHPVMRQLNMSIGFRPTMVVTRAVLGLAS